MIQKLWKLTNSMFHILLKNCQHELKLKIRSFQFWHITRKLAKSKKHSLIKVKSPSNQKKIFTLKSIQHHSLRSEHKIWFANSSFFFVIKVIFFPGSLQNYSHDPLSIRVSSRRWVYEIFIHPSWQNTRQRNPSLSLIRLIKSAHSIFIRIPFKTLKPVFVRIALFISLARYGKIGTCDAECCTLAVTQ